ncbi:MAG: hypothetical protein QOH97_3648 [Actinoplanes sp.]|nr:hypothetical protein [Actinoplanes sp.]
MAYASLTAATQAVLDALTELGQGNVHELADKSGKARSTTDKAIKTLADLGWIVAVETDADAAEGVPTRWTRAEGTDPTPDDTTDLDAADPGDEPYMDIDGNADTDAGADLDYDTDEPSDGDADPADYTDPVDIADDPTDDAESVDQDAEADTDAGEADAGPASPAEQHDDTTETGGQADNGDAADSATGPADAPGSAPGPGAAVASVVVVTTRPGDRKVMAIKGVLADCGEDGATLAVIVAESGIGLATATRLLTAMEQADAARRLPGLPERWITGPTKASEVDPNPEPPRCPVCCQTVKAFATTPAAMAAIMPLIQPDGTLHIVGPDGETHVVTLPKRPSPRTIGTTTTRGALRTDLTANGDGSQPFGRGELERLTVDYLVANPGRRLTPQDVATALSAQRNNRAISSGAVRNNMTKAAAAGQILLVSETPLTFVYTAPADNTATPETDADSDDNAQAVEPEADPTAELISDEQDTGADNAEQS